MYTNLNLNAHYTRYEPPLDDSSVAPLSKNEENLRPDRWACSVCNPQGPFTMTYEEADACENSHVAEAEAADAAAHAAAANNVSHSGSHSYAGHVDGVAASAGVTSAPQSTAACAAAAAQPATTAGEMTASAAAAATQSTSTPGATAVTRPLSAASSTPGATAVTRPPSAASSSYTATIAAGEPSSARCTHTGAHDFSARAQPATSPFFHHPNANYPRDLCRDRAHPSL
jgi:hypothetical protein